MRPNVKFVALLMGWSLLTQRCGVYSFSGASVDPNTKTVTVQTIVNQAAVVVPALSQTLTEQLKQKLIRNTHLTLVPRGGDLEFAGAITDYRIQPQATQAGEVAALNRLIITVSIDYVDNRNAQRSWSSSFSRYTDFSSTVPFASVEDKLINEITEQLVEDIFNRAFVNW